jgi:cholesterol transport system auxiliary component
MTRPLPLVALLGLLAAGCALTSKGEVLSIRWFDPETARPRITSAAPPPAESRPALELGRVTSGVHLREKIAYRDAAFEVGFYDDRRWTEIPEAFLRRALERELFEERRLARVVSGLAPVLDVELTSLEEVRGSPSKARVTLTFSLRDERRSLLERSLELERPVSEQAGADAAQRLAQALAVALTQAVQAVGGEVVDELSEVAALAAEKERALP